MEAYRCLIINCLSVAKLHTQNVHYMLFKMDLWIHLNLVYFVGTRLYGRVWDTRGVFLKLNKSDLYKSRMVYIE